MDILELKAIVQNMGVVGAGGAGFPSYVKIDERANTIILNAAECEPLLKLHQQLLALYASEICETLDLIATTINAEKIIIAVKKEHILTIESLNKCINNFPKISLHLLENVYPMGDEQVLIYETTKNVVPPAGLPIECGIVVFNVETIYNIYRGVFLSKPVTDKIVSIVAEVNSPVTLRMPIGSTIKEALDLAGGTVNEGLALVSGGPMMGTLVTEDDVITKTTNAILVLPKDHCVVRMREHNFSIEINRAASVCCQCQMCTDLCPRNALGHPIEPHKFMRAVANRDFSDSTTFTNILYCCSCGLCEMYSCPQSLSPCSLMAEYKENLRKQGIRPIKGISPKEIKFSREYRKTPEHRLEARLNLAKYNKPAPLNDLVITTNNSKVMLSQHIGVPAKAVVKQGDILEMGQIIASPEENLSVAFHAPISGQVTEVTDKYIIITKGETYD